MRWYYDDGHEDGRLERCVVEAARTRILLERYLPPAPARVLDVGGGPGVYASWLTSLGYEVHLIDPINLHLEQASSRDPAPATVRVGDARHLDDGADSFDAVIMLGPLYHLTERSERVAAMAEARRVARPGGVVVAAAISRFASLLDGLETARLLDPAFAHIVDRDLSSGQHRNPDHRPGWFTTAYFHHPDDLVREADEAGLRDVLVLAIEGPASSHGVEKRWSDPAWRSVVLDSIAAVEAEPSLLGASPHLMLVGSSG